MAVVGLTAGGVEQQDVDEARAFNSQLEALIATVPTIIAVGAPEARRLRREGKGIFPKPVFLEEAANIEVDGRGGPIPVRVIRPAGKAAGVYLHIHGGGWALGAHDIQDVALKTLADATGHVAASIGYRLAPEHPYPPRPARASEPDRSGQPRVWRLRHQRHAEPIALG